MEIKNLIFDMDDTLLPCGVFYRKVKNEFGKYQANRLGLTSEFCEKILNDIDLNCIALPGAFDRLRYPRSFRAASYALDTIAGHDTDHIAAQISFDIGNAVFSAPYYLFDGVRDMLDCYRGAGFRLFLLTKGDTEVQQAKIDQNNLTEIFGKENIFIVPKKSPSNIIFIMDTAVPNLVSSETVMIGDSLRDDIGSAIGAGVHSVWVNGNANKSWDYENVEHRPDHIISHVVDLPTIFPIKFNV